MTRILGIAPYEGLKNMMNTLAQMRGDIQLTSYVGDYKAGLDIVQELDLSNFDVIISRGGTADLIYKYSSIPVLSIGMSYYDILNATKLAQNSGESFALVGFPSTIRFASMLYDILQYNIPLYTTYDDADVAIKIEQLRKENITMIVGDNMICGQARIQGINSILITSCSESVAEAIDRAVELTKNLKEIRKENAFYNATYKCSNRKLIVLDSYSKVSFSNFPNIRKSTFQTMIRKLQPLIIKKGCQQVLRRVNGKNYMISGSCFSYDKEEMTAFEFTELDYISSNFSSICTKTQEEIKDTYVRLFYSSKSTAEIRKKMESSNHIHTIVISGEIGTGKDEIAEYLYCKGHFSNSIMIIIDCAEMTSFNFDKLFNSSDSPIFRKGHVFYFREFDNLTHEQQMQAIKLQQVGNVFSGNQFIFSIREDPRDNTLSSSCIRNILNNVSGILLQLPPLRQRIHEIPTLISIYLNELCTQGARQVAGVEPEGLNYLQSYSWSGNLQQMCRILNTLYQITTTSYIQKENVIEVLKTEDLLVQSKPTIDSTINLNQTLDKIITDVISVVLDQEGMNRTKAAQRLGICRTTLWKYLK
ncbi:Propionate catabolism activator [anaerobic digester metagenome]